MHAASSCVLGLRTVVRYPPLRTPSLGTAFARATGRGRSVVTRAEADTKATGAVMKKTIDAHLHVWPSPEIHAYPDGKEPPASLASISTAESLLKQFETANVDGALIVQPINLGFDHTYVTNCINDHPGSFVGCCLADPTVNGGGLKALKGLLTPDGPYRAVRFNPGLWPEGTRMNNSVGREMFKLAGERNAVVGFMCFHGLDLHLEDIKDLMSEFPDTKVMMDHFGFVKGVEDSNWQALLSLAEYPQVVVKASAQFRVAVPGASVWPYTSTGEQLKQLVSTFGAHRVIWGSDFPFVTEKCGYEKASLIIEQCGGGLSPEEVEKVMGGRVVRMFPGGWSD